MSFQCKLNTHMTPCVRHASTNMHPLFASQTRRSNALKAPSVCPHARRGAQTVGLPAPSAAQPPNRPVVPERGGGARPVIRVFPAAVPAGPCASESASSTRKQDSPLSHRLPAGASGVAASSGNSGRGEADSGPKQTIRRPGVRVGRVGHVTRTSRVTQRRAKRPPHPRHAPTARADAPPRLRATIRFVRPRLRDPARRAGFRSEPAGFR